MTMRKDSQIALACSIFAVVLYAVLLELINHPAYSSFTAGTIVFYTFFVLAGLDLLVSCLLLIGKKAWIYLIPLVASTATVCGILLLIS